MNVPKEMRKMILAVLKSPEGQAAIRETMRQPQPTSRMFSGMWLTQLMATQVSSSEDLIYLPQQKVWLIVGQDLDEQKWLVEDPAGEFKGQYALSYDICSEPRMQR